MSAKHRISFDLSKPFKILGMTMDEIAIGLGGFFFYTMSNNKVVGGIFFALGIFVVIVVKQFKKRTVGFNLKSYLWWYGGYESKAHTLEPSKTRRIG